MPDPPCFIGIKIDATGEMRSTKIGLNMKRNCRDSVATIGGGMRK